MYYPKPTEEGVGILKGALRRFVLADLSAHGLPSVTELLIDGQAGVIDEGFMTSETPTPLVMFSTGGDGASATNSRESLHRFLLYVIDRGRGLSTIERIIDRLRWRFSVLADEEHPAHAALTAEYFLLPPTVRFRIERLEAPGTTFSATLPAWRAESRGLYVFVTVSGLAASN